jgi:hypothetical protein
MKAWQRPSGEEEVAVDGDNLESSLQHEGGIGLMRRYTKGRSGSSGPALTETRATVATATQGGAALRGLWWCNLDKMQ